MTGLKFSGLLPAREKRKYYSAILVGKEDNGRGNIISGSSST